MPAPGARRLAVDAHLDLTVDGHPVAVRSDGGRLRVEVDSPQTAYRLFQSARPGRALVRTLTDTLDAFGVDVVVVVGGRDVATLGASVRAGRVLTALGLSGVAVAPLLDRPQRRLLLVAAAFGAAVAGGVWLGRRR